MIGFFVKKAFINGWDNLLWIILFNIAIIGVGVGGFFLVALTNEIVPLSAFILASVVLIEGIVFVTVSGVSSRIADYKSIGFSDIVEVARDTWKHGILYVLTLALACFVFFVAIRYYLALHTMLGFSFAVVMFWIAVVFTLSFQWFLPVRSQLDGRFFISLKKCFIIFLDNPGFSLFMLFYSIVLIVMSIILVLLIPGIAGLILAQNEAFRLRMYKYDWLEKNPEPDFKKARKNIPWEELIAEDREIVGTRSLRSFLFPWKY